MKRRRASAVTGRSRRPWSRRGGQEGFSLMEVLIAGFVLVVGLIAISQFFTSAVWRVMDSNTRSVLVQVANQELEKIRALPYADVGIKNSQPGGQLDAQEVISDVNGTGITVTVQREITFVQDASYTGPYPANYRRVTIRVSADSSRLRPVVVSTNVAGGAAGGALNITVLDSGNRPVSDAYIVVRNTFLNVNIDSPSIRTDSQGHLLIPGLTPDSTPRYIVTANKAGYNSDSSEPQIVLDGNVVPVVLVIDRLSTLILHTVDQSQPPVLLPDIQLLVTGPKGFVWSGATDSAGTKRFDNILRFSTGEDPYNVIVAAGQGYEETAWAITLPADQTVETNLPLVPLTTTTTAPPSPTTSVSTPPTTTGHPSLTVTARRWSNGQYRLVSGATVQVMQGGTQVFNGQTASGGSVVISGILTYGITYTVHVSWRNNDHTYTGTATVTMNESQSIVVTLSS